MSVAEMKKVIHDKVEALSEVQLQELNRMLDNLNSNAEKEYDLSEYVESIVSERAEVLKKLAQ